MKITRDEARRIAALARLQFDDAALDRLAGEMTRILEYIDQLKEARVRTPALQDDAVGARVSSPAPEATTPLRDDTARKYPKIVDGFFIVPKVIE